MLLKPPVDESDWLRIVHEVIIDYGRVTTPIYINKPQKSGRASGEAFLLGTGFFITYQGMTFLVTAAHVIKGLDTETLFGGHVQGKAFLLNGIPFIFCHDNDLAIAPLPAEWLLQNGMEDVPALPLDQGLGGEEPLGHWITMGYPATKNGINPKLAKFAINLHGTSFTEMIQAPVCKAHIRDPLAFRFDKKSAITVEHKRENPPSFSGTSGSPVLQIFCRVLRPDLVDLSCRLEGVFLGWHHKEREVIAGKVQGLVGLLDEFLGHLCQVLQEQ